MTLHEAMQQVLTENKRPMTITEITDAINKRGLYVQQAGTPATSDQIVRRANKKMDLFEVTISLNRK